MSTSVSAGLQPVIICCTMVTGLSVLHPVHSSGAVSLVQQYRGQQSQDWDCLAVSSREVKLRPEGVCRFLRWRSLAQVHLCCWASQFQYIASLELLSSWLSLW